MTKINFFKTVFTNYEWLTQNRYDDQYSRCSYIFYACLFLFVELEARICIFFNSRKRNVMNMWRSSFLNISILVNIFESELQSYGMLLILI